MYVCPRLYQATMCTDKHKPNRYTGLSWILGSLPPPPPPTTRGVKLPLYSLSRLRGENTPEYAPTLGSLPTHPTPEHLTELNAESFFVFFLIKIFITEGWEDGRGWVGG